MNERIDPITFEVVKNALGTLADEMALVILRTAYPDVLRDTMDCSTAMCDAQGRFIAQGLTNPIHLGSFPDAMRRIVAEHGDTARAGDVFIFNDPYGSGGMHLPDFFIVRPAFAGAELIGYAATLGHQADVGGIAPGGMALYATEIHQEGLRIPLMKLYDEGRPNTTMFQILEKNVRVPDKVFGDIRALLAASASGERGLERLVARQGIDNFKQCVEALHDHAERLMRQEISALPDGVYEFEDWLDGLGERPEPVRFKVAITIAGENVEIDWEGTAPQLKYAINGPLPTTNSMGYLAVRCAVRAPIPNCQGFTRPITIKAPLGTVVNPIEPAACASRGLIAYRMLDTMFGALAQAAPDRIPAACEGGPSAPQYAGTHNGKRFVTGGGMLGCWGGRRFHDGLDGVCNPGCNLSNQPIELVEASVPMEISRYGFVENSGGPGRSRGGYALIREVRMLADETSLHMRSDRRAILPYGLSGGRPGTPSWNIMNPGPEQHTLPVCPMHSVALAQGDTFRHVQPGGGGHGDPLERDPEKVLDAVDNEMITVEYAREVYGVVVLGRRIDQDATTALRATMRAGPRDEDAYLRHFYRSLGIDPVRDAPRSSGGPR